MAEKRTIELDVQANLGSLKSQLKQAQQEVQTLSDKFGATSSQAVAAAKAAAILKDKIGDAKTLTDAFNPDAKFKSLSGSLTGVASGFSVATGAMGLFGQQNEDVEKALLKVQSAMALASGLQGIGEARDSFKQLGGVIKDSYQSLLRLIVGQQAGAVVATEVAVATGAEVVATEGAAVAQLSLNAAMRANPIGAILTGVVLLTTAIVGLVMVMGDQSSEQKKQSELAKRNAEDRKESAKYVAKESAGFLTLISQLKQSNAGSKERQELITKINNNYGTTLKNLQNESNFQASLNAEVASYIEYQKAKYKLQKNEGLITGNLEKQDDIQTKISKTQKELNKLIKEGAYEKKSMYETDDLGRRTFIGYIQDTDKVLAANKLKERLAEQKQSLTDTKERLDKYAESSLNAEEKINNLTNGGKKYNETIDNISSSTDKNTNSVDAASKSNEELIQSLKNLQTANEELGKNETQLLDLKKQRDLEALQLTFNNSLQDEQAKQSLIDAKLLIETKYYQDLSEIQNRSRQLEIKKEDAQFALHEEAAYSAKEKEIAALVKSYEDKFAIVAGNDLLEQELTIKQKEELKAIEDKHTSQNSKETIAAFAAVAETKKEIRDADIANTLAGIQLISNLFKGNRKVQAAALIAENALAIAKTIIVTKASNQAARAAGTAGAIETLGASSVAAEALVLRNNVGAGISIAGIVAATGKGLAALKEGGSPTGGDIRGGGNTGGGGGGGGGNSVMSANFNVVGNSGINQLGQLQQKPMKAYVVSGEMSTAQSLDRNRIENATVVQ